MRKYMPLFVIMTVLLFMGCANNSKKLTDEQIFDKNQECSKHTNERQQKLGKSVFFTIFYSPNLNTCVLNMKTSEIRGVLNIFTKEWYLLENKNGVFFANKDKILELIGSYEEGLQKLEAK